MPILVYTGRRTVGAIAYPKNLALLNTDDTVPRIFGMISIEIVSSEDHIHAVPHPNRKRKRTNA